MFTTKKKEKPINATVHPISDVPYIYTTYSKIESKNFLLVTRQVTSDEIYPTGVNVDLISDV